MFSLFHCSDAFWEVYEATDEEIKEINAAAKVEPSVPETITEEKPSGDDAEEEKSSEEVQDNDVTNKNSADDEEPKVETEN